MAVLVVVGGWLALNDPALAAAPEMPVTGEAKEVTGSSATLTGVINPIHAGEAGTYEFLYRQSATECERAGAAVNATGAEPAPGTSPYPVAAKLTEVLLPGTTYTFCLLARNASGQTAVGSPETFTTPTVAPSIGNEASSQVGSSGATLSAKIDPGGLATTYFVEYGPNYESTTPVQSAGAGSEPEGVSVTLKELQPETLYRFRFAASNAKAPGPVTGEDQSFSTFPVALLGLPDERSFELVSPLEDGNATPLIGTPVRAAADGSAIAYTGSAPPTGGSGTAGSGLGKRPFGTNEYVAKRFGGGGWKSVDIQPHGLSSAHYEGLSSDLSVGILGSRQPLTEGAPSGEDLYARDGAEGGYQLLAANGSYEGATADGSNLLVKTSEGRLYDAVGGQLASVNVLPGGGIASDATFGSTTGDLERVISEPDGARIFWTDATTGDLYVRENAAQADASTVLIAENAQFQGASSTGSMVLFTDEKQLTSNSTAAAEAPDLYEYDLESGVTVDLSAAEGGEHADVVGVLGASEDGTYVYFAAAGALPGSGAQHQECRTPTEQEFGQGLSTKCNVYVVHEEGAPKLVVSVAAADGEGGKPSAVVIEDENGNLFGDWAPGIGYRTAHVTPDGRQLVFESFYDLAGFHGEEGREVYMYDYGSGVSCVSCNPTGASTVHGHGEFAEYAHAELPNSSNATYALRDVSANGDRVFFESNERLVSQSTSGEIAIPLYTYGLTNVYEWEREGTDESCPAKAGGRASDGCIFLLSGGTSTDMSFFVDASESGNDVFIETRAQLVPQDHGETFEVYDARVGAQELSPPVCVGSGCQGSPSAQPIFATPSSITFDGVGNFTSPPPPAKKAVKTVKCAKGKKLEHGKCVKPRRKKIKGKKAKSKRAKKSGRAAGVNND